MSTARASPTGPGNPFSPKVGRSDPNDFFPRNEGMVRADAVRADRLWAPLRVSGDVTRVSGDTSAWGARNEGKPLVDPARSLASTGRAG